VRQHIADGVLRRGVQIELRRGQMRMTQDPLDVGYLELSRQPGL
jgi:hypothetical protein